MIRVAINGFGRIGRLVLRAGINDKKIRFVAINDLTDPGTLAHLLRCDSVHRTFPGTIEAKKDSIIVNGQEIKVVAEKEPKRLPWKKLKVDIALECTGLFRKKEELEMHQKAGAQKVLLSAPEKGDKPVKNIVMGVNDKTYDGEELVSNASCTTNCFAPMVKVIHDCHKILDGPHKDLRRARAAALNIIPTSTGASKAIAAVIPELEGKIIGSAIRVPTPDGSLCQFICGLDISKKLCITEEVNELFKKMSKTKMKGIIEYSKEALVSTDVIGNPHSCVFDSQLTRCIKNNLFVTGWYDNEWGYSNRMIDVAKLMMK